VRVNVSNAGYGRPCVRFNVSNAGYGPRVGEVVRVNVVNVDQSGRMREG